MSRVTASLEALVAVAAGPIGRGSLLALALVSALAAVAVWRDAPGLEASYFTHPGERRVLVRADDRLTVEPALATGIFHYTRLFTVRWRGWMLIEEGAEVGFRITSSGPASLAIDGREVLARERGRRRASAAVTLDRGLHLVEMRFDHGGDQVAFALETRRGRGGWSDPERRALFDRRPGPVRRLVRAATGGLNPVGRKLVAALLVLAALGALHLAALGRPGALPRRLAGWAVDDPRRRRRWAGAGLALLFVVAAAAIFPRTGSPFGWDDVRYLDMAAFDKDMTWVLNRYAHVYLLDFFIWLARGDAFLGARLFWSAQFGLVVCSFAVCAANLGPRLQVGTFVVSLLLLFAQPLYFLRAGASVPDTTVGTLVIAGVALYLYRWRAGPRRHEWPILLLGAITVWAVKSKELGIILMWPAALLVFEAGRLDLRGFVRRAARWLAGAAAGLALLMVFDTAYFGDPLYGLRPANLSAVNQFNLQEEAQQSRDLEGWMDVIGRGRTPVATADPRMKHFALLVCAAALAAGWRRRSIELRLLHLMPILYVVMLMLIHVKGAYVFLARYLYPIAPLSAFLAAAAFHHLGLDELRWRDVRSPRFFVPAVALAFLIAAIVVPYDTFWIEPEDFLPAQWLTSIEWHSLDAFVRLVAAPVLILCLVMALAVFQRHPPTRLLLAATLVAVFLGQPFFRTVWELRTARAWQRGASNLHGLEVLGDEIPAESGVWVNVFPTLIGREKMFGARETCERITAVYLRRRDLRVTCWPAVMPEQDAVFMTTGDYRGWIDTWPALADTAVFSPAGEVILVRPSRAGEPPPAYYE